MAKSKEYKKGFKDAISMLPYFATWFNHMNFYPTGTPGEWESVMYSGTRIMSDKTIKREFLKEYKDWIPK